MVRNRHHMIERGMLLLLHFLSLFLSASSWSLLSVITKYLSISLLTIVRVDTPPTNNGVVRVSGEHISVSVAWLEASEVTNVCIT